MHLVEQELQSVGMGYAERFSAIVAKKGGAIGCTLSHIAILMRAMKENWNGVCIVEDDIQFTNPNVFVHQLLGFFREHKPFDVLLLAGNNVLPISQQDDNSNHAARVRACQTTTGYFVAKHYIPVLLDNFRNGAKKLMREPANTSAYAIDRHWFCYNECIGGTSLCH